MELGTLGIALVVVIGVPLITAGYAFLAERMLTFMPERRRASYRPWLWLLPGFAFLIAYLIYPTVSTFFLSFQNRDSTAFVGLENYTRLFGQGSLLADAAQHRPLDRLLRRRDGDRGTDHRRAGGPRPLRVGRQGHGLRAAGHQLRGRRRDLELPVRLQPNTRAPSTRAWA